MNSISVSEQVHRIAETLPSEATWDDVRYQIDLRASIERGMADIKAGRVHSMESMLKEFGIDE